MVCLKKNSTVRQKVDLIFEIPLTEIQIRDRLRYITKSYSGVETNETDKIAVSSEDYAGAGRNQIVASSKKIDVESVEDHSLTVVPPTDEFSKSECSDDEVIRNSRVLTSYSRAEELLLRHHFRKHISGTELLIKRNDVLKIIYFYLHDQYLRHYISDLVVKKLR